MSAEHAEVPVGEARDHFSELVHRRAAALVPVELVEAYEEMLDREDGPLATDRLADLRTGRYESISAADAARELDL